MTGRRTHIAWIIVLMVAAPLAGCDNRVASVSGTVTLDGQPVEGSPELYGTVSFYRVDGTGSPAVGIIGKAGRYAVFTGSSEGLLPGQYRVGVSVKRIHPPATPGGLTRPERISDPRFARPEESGLSADVKPGTNTFDFALTSAGT